MKRTLSAVGFSLLALNANAQPAPEAEARAEAKYVEAFIHGGNLRAYRLERSRRIDVAARDAASAGASRASDRN